MQGKRQPPKCVGFPLFRGQKSESRTGAEIAWSEPGVATSVLRAIIEPAEGAPHSTLPAVLTPEEHLLAGAERGTKQYL